MMDAIPQSVGTMVNATNPNMTQGAFYLNNTLDNDLGSNSTMDINYYYDYNLADLLLFQYHTWGIAGNIISILGLIGNVFSVIVLANRRMMSSTSVYLIALAVFDSIVLISLVLFLALPTFYNAKGFLEGYYSAYPYMHPYAYPAALTAQTCSIYTTVAFTVERFIAVCRPLKAAKMCTISRARKAVIIIILSSLVYNIPRMLEYRTIMVFDESRNATRASFEQTALGQNTTFRHIYFIYMNIIVMMVIPFSTLAVLNICLIRAVNRSVKTQGKVNQKTRRENSLTVMLISVVIVFLICQVPSIVDNIFQATFNEDVLMTSPFVKLTTISNLMVITNSAVNFYIYCVFGRKFRRVFCRIFCLCYPSDTQSLLTNESSLMYAVSQRNPANRNTMRMNNNLNHEQTCPKNSHSPKSWNKLQMSVYENGKTRSYCANGKNTKYTMIDQKTHL